MLQAVGRTPSGKKIAADKAGVAVADRGFINVDSQMRTNVPHKAVHEALHEAHMWPLSARASAWRQRWRMGLVPICRRASAKRSGP